ncbi:MAG: polyprenyl diphosphate synthase [Eubacteriales bacterium]|nr:polyprenyl diphosphate synthase [Eubacteriales bacterium]
MHDYPFHSDPEREIRLLDELRAGGMRVPQHLAFIMDGNRRFAKREGIALREGHRLGAMRMREIALYLAELGISYVTVYAFSTENKKRAKSEVSALMQLFARFFRDYQDELVEHGVIVRFLAERDGLPASVIQTMDAAESRQSTGRLHLQVAFNYGSRMELLRAAQRFALITQERPELLQSDNPELLRDYLYQPDLPDPDLLFRSGGEQRISNYLLWQLAYTELYFTKRFWPELTVCDILEALLSYANRQRRFGGTL